jgi:alpha-L-fucosidase 2
LAGSTPPVAGQAGARSTGKSHAAPAPDASGSAIYVDYAGVISRSDIVLERPNSEPSQAMPLGNGRLGVAVWSANGLTAQLNRVDTLPDRVPVARVEVPGLVSITGARDYSGRLDLHNAEFHERGAGTIATVFVDAASDNLVIDVTGANPSETQTVKLSLAPPRAPQAETADNIAILSETWIDDKQPGASGRKFGSLAAVTAEGRDVSAQKTDKNAVAVSFRPYPDGHLRIIVAAPHFNADAGPAAAVARQTLSKVPRDEKTTTADHRNWWHNFWQRAGYMKITSPDGAGEYMENLRALYLYSAAAQSGSEYPGSQAGVADMFSSVPTHNWDPGAFWHWNLRMQVAANLSAGVPELNAPYFNLYRENLGNIQEWTRKHMKGLPGICVPETMRFNGQGIEYETWDPAAPIVALNCDAGFKPYYNARTISTGAEVSLWIWQQYLATNDRVFLAHNFPVMAESARFLLAYESAGKDGLMHTSPSNAHETQWDLQDPTTDLAARMALYRATIEAAQTLGSEPELVKQMQIAQGKIPPFPRTEVDKPKTLLPSSADAAAEDVIADSYLPSAEQHNVENIGLDPVWPFDLIGDTSQLFDLARRTYLHRLYPVNQDWSFDPIQTARLGMRDEVRLTLIQLTEKYQTFVNGFANWGGKTGEFYIEQQGVVATALQEALVQDYDGIIRINPALPKEWDTEGRVFVRGKTKVDVKLTAGALHRVIIEAGSTTRLKVRNPWGYSAVNVIAEGHPSRKLDGPILEFAATAGQRYQLAPAGQISSPNTPVAGTPAIAPRRLGPVQIGLFADSH